VIWRVLVFLDLAFFVLHTALMAFNLCGWAWRRTRALHLIVLTLTAASWFLLGAFYGWGYCLCTDWHFQVREKLGYVDPYSSYLQLLAAQFGGFQLSKQASDWIAGAAFGLIVLATAVTWTRVGIRRQIVRSGKAELPGAVDNLVPSSHS
jgi:hypothetical protein